MSALSEKSMVEAYVGDRALGSEPIHSQICHTIGTSACIVILPFTKMKLQLCQLHLSSNTSRSNIHEECIFVQPENGSLHTSITNLKVPQSLLRSS